MFRTNLRYITDRIDRRGFGAELSTLAEVVVEKAFELSVEAMRSQLGTPRLEDGSECGWAVARAGQVRWLRHGLRLRPGAHLRL